MSESTSISKLELINDYFKLPINYNSEIMEIKKEIVKDLELISNIDPSGSSMLDYAFKPKTIFGKKVIEQFGIHYTTDIEYLKDSQELIKKFKNEKEEIFKPDYENVMGIWDDIKNDTGFKERYRYIDWKMWEFLNKNERFLQVMSIYDMASPVLSLLSPIIIFIVPFLVIKLKGLKICWSEYIEILKSILSNQPIGKLFTQFNKVKIEQKIYLILTSGFYIFTIYQNILACIRFHSNMKKMHTYINDLKIYLKHSIQSMDNYLNFSSSLKSYSEFNENIKKQKKIIEELKDKMNKISPWELSFVKIRELGTVQKIFYEIYCDEKYNDAIMYSFGFNGYIDNLNGLIQNVNEKKMNFTKFNNNSKKCYFKNAYYPTLIDKTPVKNTYKFKKNMIITGPNASGKTTILKTSLINILITQQFGCGFYKSAQIKPYKYIHCYLNIPDTSGRDSLFQAEARRCKEIIDLIDQNKNDEHFCAFDELYSGTNPDEAVISAMAFMEYLIKNSNVTCILTTHFIKLCEYLDKNDSIKNYHMKTKQTENDFKYLYLLEKGISTIRGGIKVLSDMNYPKEILENTKLFNSNSNSHNN
jgi:DNA mismatch repair ATPase MutS